eukprot:3782101-Pyramimonas_sp.AAC.1
MGPRNAVLGGRSAGSKGCAGRWRTHAGGATGTFGGWGHETLCSAGETQGAKAALGGGGRTRAVPLGPSLELSLIHI